ncbi:hypothetical protein OS493_026343 [Desmophyllum pertusum]|uniref:Uncharacterized protein n=1 Tax=Desmophyllum pertusum TaxID=174260 RepID=A0A9W9Z9Q5_9CNID|nr:hypothetical protein OS493_026343 [Desmophyllum pertusum]
MEAEHISESQVQGQQRENGSNTYIDFLDAVRNGTEEDVKDARKRLLPLSSDDTGRRAAIEEENDEDDLSKKQKQEQKQKQKLLEALENKDVGAVWKLIAETAKESDVKTLETLNETCQSVAAHESLKEGGLIKCLWGKLKSQIRCACGSASKCREDKPKQTEFQHEEEQQWIKILCNPLYIGLEWLWRNNPKSGRKTSSTPHQTKRKESKFEDVIEAALDDAYLLEKIALCEHHYSRDEYTRRALECEKFAVDVVEGSNLGQLHEIMDINGNGCLLLRSPKILIRV